MVKQALVFAVLAGCVDSASTTSQSITPYAAVDYFLILDGIKGESQDRNGNLKDVMVAWSFTDADHGQAGLATNCVGFGCRFDLVEAVRQSNGDGTTSVWRLSSDVPSLDHAVIRGTSADDMFTVNLSSAGQEEIALTSLLDCHIPPDCGHQTKGLICVPICTLR
jgi:hypothetical protein